MHSSPQWFRVCAVTAIMLHGGSEIVAQVASDPAASSATNRIDQLRALTLEDLLHKEISSVSKRPEDWFKAPAAVFVIPNEEIRRSGATRLAEVLRLAPGINVGQLDANTWAVSARGFNDVYADKLLVMIDGRSVYSPYTAGVFWNTQDYLLEDIDRIEVIRGPGGTLWGANAVNGVVNIITKDAEETQGVYVTGAGGTEERGMGGVRYGMKVADDAFARTYVKYANRDNYSDGVDSSDMLQAGLRFDWKPENTHITLQGDYYDENHGNRITYPSYYPPYLTRTTDRFNYSGGNGLFRYHRQFSEESDLQLQAFYDHTRQEENGYERLQDNYDVEFQHRFALPARQNLMYGVGYRYSPDKIENTPNAVFVPSERHVQVFSAFVQDEISVVPDKLKLTLGSKVEHNDYTQWEYQPSGRLLWLPAERHAAWLAVSRAVQVPNRNANDFRTATTFPTPPVPVEVAPGVTLPLFFTGGGSHDIEAQELIAYELGYRFQPKDNLSFDVASFFHDYEGLFVGNVGQPHFVGTPTPHLEIDSSAINAGTGFSYGVELAANWNATDWWRLSGTYSYLKIELEEFASAVFAEDKDPRHQFSVRSSMNLPWNIDFDLWLRYVDELPGFNISSYYDLDARLAWRPNRNWELALVGQNLIEPKRVEFGANPFAPYQERNPVPRGAYAQLTYRF